MSFRRSILLLFLCPFGFLSVPTAHLYAQTTRRLILKDGSYQIVTKYEIQGDRVHYYSAERGEWEDVPDSLIDWEATNKYERERAAGKVSPEAQALDREMEAERQQEEAESPHVAPGLRLPPEGGVYALDTYLSEPELLPLDQSNGEINRHVGRNVVRSAINPVAGSKRTIELPGPRANIQVHASLPTIYINLEPVDEENASSAAESDVTSRSSKPGATKPAAEPPGDRFQIVRVQVKGDKRIVGAIKTAVLGKSHPEEELIPATAEQFGKGWVKLTPKAPLQPGEYALVEMLGKQGMNSYVWDFGAHADAPANLAVIKPEKTKSDTTLPQPTTLQQRK
jgi:hypothetical protein